MSEQENKENIEQKETVENPVEQNTGQTDDTKDKKKQKKEKDDKRKWYVIITILLFIIIIILILLLLRQCSSDVPVLNPDFPPQVVDPNAKPIPDDDKGKLDHEEGGGAVILDYSNKMTIDLSDKQATLSFLNPGRSSSNMVLWLMIQDTVIAQSGLIIPGYQIENLDLIKNAAKSLVEGVYNGKFVVYYYDPETNERALVNSELPITITVTP